MKAAFKNVIRQRYLSNGQTRALAIGRPVNYFYLILMLFAFAGMFITSSLINVTRSLHPNFKPSITLVTPQPEHVGSVTFGMVENSPATVVMAGDSLARGKGSRTTNGTVENIGYYLVQKANTVEPGIARYHVLSGLSVDGSPVEDMNQRIAQNSKSLATIPNLVLVMSFTNRDLVNFVVDAKNAQSSNRLIEFFKVLGILRKDSTQYQHSLTDLRLTLNDLHAKRVQALGPKKASMQAVILGVPNEAYSPSVKAILHTYGITYDELSYVINTYNADDYNAAVVGNNEHAGVSYSFVNLDRLHVPEKTALSYISSDQFHPNYRGYQSLAEFIGQRIVVQGKTQSMYLANE